MLVHAFLRTRPHSLRNPSHFRSLSHKAKINQLFTDPDPHKTKFLGSVTKPAELTSIGGGGLPEVVFIGRANVGKSTLINAVALGAGMGGHGKSQPLVKTSSRPGSTQAVNFFRIGGQLVVVDAPGYGLRGRQEWGEIFQHYVESRQELKRVYLLFNASHVQNSADELMLQMLDQIVQESSGLRFQIQGVLTKSDQVPTKDLKTRMQLVKNLLAKEAATSMLPLLVTSCKPAFRFSIDNMRESIAQACNLP